MQEETNFIDYYAILGITPAEASDEQQLKKAFKKAALNTHPDRNRGNEKEAHNRFILVTKAFQVLNNPKERAAYDAANPTAGKFKPAVPSKNPKAQQSSEPVLSLMYKPVVTQTWGDYDVLRKFVFFGEAGGPKTKIFQAQTDPMFGKNSTVGIDFMLKNLVRNGQRIKLQLWDLAGQERFRAMQKIYTRGATGAVVIVNASEMKSIEDMQWRISEMRKTLGDTAVISVVASWDGKYNAIESEQELKAHCQKMGAECFAMVNIADPADIFKKCETVFEEMCDLLEAKEFADAFDTTVDKAKEMIAQQRAQREVVMENGNNNGANNNNTEEGLGDRLLRFIGIRK